MSVSCEPRSGKLELASPLDMYRAVCSYEGENEASPASLGIAARLFDGDAHMADIRQFAVDCQRGRAVYTSLGALTVSDGIAAGELTGLYARRGLVLKDSDPEVITSFLADGGYLALAVSRTALRGITVAYQRHWHEWREQDEARKRAVGWASIEGSVFARNNMRQHSGGVKGPSFQAADAVSDDWHGVGNDTPDEVLPV